MIRNNLIARLKQIEIIINKPVTLRSGEISEYYCDIKKAFGYPDILNALADGIVNILPVNTTVIASSGYGGLPFGSVVASRSGKKFTAVRDALKDHGKRTKIDGYIPTKDDIVVVIDDVLTTGSSIRATALNLNEAQIEVNSAIVIVRRVDVSFDFPCAHLFNIDELK